VCVFDLSGATNVLLFLTIRPGLLLFKPPKEYAEAEDTVEIGVPTTEMSNVTENNRSSRATASGKEFSDYGELDPPPVNGVTATLSRIESRPDI
jgi:hypothetical protein